MQFTITCKGGTSGEFRASNRPPTSRHSRGGLLGRPGPEGSSQPSWPTPYVFMSFNERPKKMGSSAPGGGLGDLGKY